MNRFNRSFVDLIRKTMWFTMFVFVVLLMALPTSAAFKPDDKDNKDKNRQPPPSNFRPADTGRRSETPRYTPPPRQTPAENMPKMDRPIRQEMPRRQDIAPPARNIPVNPPVAKGPSPSSTFAPRNAEAMNRGMRNNNPSGGQNFTPPKNFTPPPASTVLPRATRKVGDMKMDVLGEMQQRAQRDTHPSLNEIRNRLAEKDDKKKDPAGNQPPNNLGNKNVERPINRNPDPPIGKSNDRPIGNQIIERPINKNTDNPPIGPIGNKIIDKPVNKNPDNPIGPIGKTTDKPIGNRIIDKPINKNLDNPIGPIGKPTDKPLGNKIIDKPVDNNLNKPKGNKFDKPFGDKPVDRDNILGKGGLRRPDNDSPPDKKEFPRDIIKGPDIDKGPLDKSDHHDKNDAFRPGRFPKGGSGKDGLPDPNTKTGVKKDFLPPADIDKNPGKFPGIRPHSPGRVPPTAKDIDQFRPIDKTLRPRFDDRLKSGQLDVVAKSDIGKKLDLADQFKNMQKGDVARRMDLQKHVAGFAHPDNATVRNLKGIPPHPHYYYGRISPVYVDHCFKYRYYGHSFFAGECWYPHWNPWVVWSWGYHVHPVWDPRPIWCRPVIYQPYVVWTWWAPPAWQPLPETNVGTWVDVKPVVVEPEKYDLQLLAVRMVDPGHPEEKLGPRYRVWFRNNSPQPITEPFTVMIFASNEKQFAQELPRAGVRVTSIEAGDTQSADIRLPIEVYEMNRDAAGQSAPFEFLHFFVDANREVNDINRENNGAVVPRDEMLPVDPASFEIDPQQGRADTEVIVAGEGFGPQPGRALLLVDGKEYDAEIVGWYDLGAKVVLPKTEIAAPTEAELIVIRGDGAAANPLKITLLPDEEATIEWPEEP